MTRILPLALIGVAFAAGDAVSGRPVVRMKPCAIANPFSVECGTVTVFENRARRAGRTIDLNFIVVRAEQRGSPDALALLSGGPGEGATSQAPAVSGWIRPAREAMDVLLVDQRGTGESNPLECAAEAAADPAAVFGNVYDPAALARCRDALQDRADLTQYTTDVAAVDLDDVRAALGYARLSLYGVSYGSRMAQAYLRRFPSHTRSVVLDGPVPFDINVPLSYAASGQQALDRVLTAAARPDAAAAFAGLLRRLDAGPVAATIQTPAGATVTVRFSRGDFGYAIRGLLYRASAVATLPAAIVRAASTGSFDEFAQAYYLRELTLEGAVALGMHLSVLCAEDVPFATDAEIESATANTFLGRYLFDEYRRACEVWPRARLAADARTPAAGGAPVLLVSGYFDPVTPPGFGDRIARSLPFARTIVSPEGAHGSAYGCPRPAALHVLRRGTLEGLPDVCR